MKNIDRIAKIVTKSGAKNMLIHTVPGTPNWIVAEKIEEDKWILTLENPLKNSRYGLGVFSHNQHLGLWKELFLLEIDNNISQIELAKELKKRLDPKR